MENIAGPREARRVPDWFALTPGMALAFDRDGRVVFANERWLAAFGYTRDGAIGRDRADLFVGEAPNPIEDVNGEFAMVGGDGVARRVSLDSGNVEGFTLFIVHDATPQRSAGKSAPLIRDEEAPGNPRRETRSEALYRQIVEASNDVIMLLDRNLVRTYVSPASREVFGYEPEALVGKKTGESTHPEDAERFKRALVALAEGRLERYTAISRRRHRDGRWIWVETKYRALIDPSTGETIQIIGMGRDITERRAVEEQLADAYRRLEVLAGQDGLTGLANRRSFDERLTKEFRLAQRRRGTLGLALFDVDQFKAFNDRYGHPAGDECLKQVAGAIHDALDGHNGLAARLGGDEFAVIAPSVGESGIAELGERICETIRKLMLPHPSSSWRYRLSHGPTSLIADADRALYAAKALGRNRVERFSSLGTAAGQALAS
jgi:diguanylate cyclase (GGDEF)-like protein/PAS domain S-box-containing protein